MMDEFKEGQYIIYKNGNSYEIGKIKRVVNDGAFVFYSEGDTASKTPFGCMHEIINDYAIGETNLGGRITPARRGHWVKVSGYITPGGDPLWKCSECGKGLHLYGIEHGSYGSDVADSQWVACPNCGAMMSEVEE